MRVSLDAHIGSLVESRCGYYDLPAVVKAAYLSDQFASGLPYDRYVQTGTDEQQRRWSQVYDAARLTDSQKQLVGGFVRGMKILIFSGIWCGDCVEQCPLIQRIAQVNASKIDLRFIQYPQFGRMFTTSVGGN
jgi:thiol-disulfide isomerase/thioredoxin